MTTRGTLIAESLHDGAELADVRMTVTNVARLPFGDVAAGQPAVWTVLEFEIDDGDAGQLAAALEGALRFDGGWYCDFQSDEETVVVFAGRTFRYRRGDTVGRAAATKHGRSVGVPETQLDWPT